MVMGETGAVERGGGKKRRRVMCGRETARGNSGVAVGVRTRAYASIHVRCAPVCVTRVENRVRQPTCCFVLLGIGVVCVVNYRGK